MQKPKPLTDADRARAVARYACMRGRGVELHFKSRGQVVEARSPDQLRDASTEPAMDRPN